MGKGDLDLEDMALPVKREVDPRVPTDRNKMPKRGKASTRGTF